MRLGLASTTVPLHEHASAIHGRILVHNTVPTTQVVTEQDSQNTTTNFPDKISKTILLVFREPYRVVRQKAKNVETKQTTSTKNRNPHRVRTTLYADGIKMVQIEDRTVVTENPVVTDSNPATLAVLLN